ncbi:thiol-disulfide isomerase/thioredoxin/chaperonin cofactor prefoldin [Dysgonomonadaceae bacterium PH5-43]|nr:thiol-disulfide isomerase/thioredoxin/chaperonin cofactor prefoldin [Dysgonomonadaceae bacterium PH5-43]
MALLLFFNTIMNTKYNKYLILSILFAFTFSISDAFSQMPEKYIGNWINEKNNNWEYGFFEDFVIFNCDYWTYESVKVDNKGKLLVTLQKESEKLELKISTTDDKHIKIKSGKGKDEKFVLMEKEYPNYKNKDLMSFPTPVFRSDSATIIGYFRNMDKIPEIFADRLSSSTFTVAVPNFLQREEVDYSTTIDSSGRFKITFPIIDSNELFVDWQRTNLQVVVEPGDVLFLYVDMNDFVPLREDGGFEGYFNRSKQVLFMGNNARVNNEIIRYKSSNIHIDREGFKDVSDMEYLYAVEDVYNRRMQVLNEYIEHNPNVSEKFKFYNKEKERYKFASDLMQRRFNSYSKKDKSLQEGYVEYVEKNIPLDNEVVYSLIRDFCSFLSDYIGYKESIQSNMSNIFDNIEERLSDNNNLTDELKELLAKHRKLSAKIELTDNKEQLAQELNAINKQLFSNKIFLDAADELTAETLFDLEIADSLIENPNLRELWAANRYYYWFDNIRKPLSTYQQNIFKEKVSNPFLYNYINDIQNHYVDIVNSDIYYEASLKNVDHLNDCQDADKLFEELIKDYKGKVIYVDFWGTWCGPCRENMKIAKEEIKEQFKDKDVVFMYFANRSTEISWKNFIKELNLTGENIVHYRLPAAQQAIIEQKFSITSFPTYMLINKNGNVVNTNAEPPRNRGEVIKQISELL